MKNLKTAVITASVIAVPAIIGYGSYRYYIANTSYETKTLKGEVIDRAERHTSNPSLAINTNEGDINGHFNTNANDDYYIQIKLENGEVFTKHGMTYFDSHYIGEPVTVIAVDRYFKNEYKSTSYKIAKEVKAIGNQIKASPEEQA